MTEAQVKKRTKAAWSPAARAKRKATLEARRKAEKIQRTTPVVNLTGLRELGVLSPPSTTTTTTTFTAEQVMELLRELWRKGP